MFKRKIILNGIKRYLYSEDQSVTDNFPAMKQCFVIALLVIVATATDVDSSSSSAFRVPAYPPSCCSSRIGCTTNQLASYCPACVSNCPGLIGCPCLFPGTNEVINPRPPPPAVPRAPFCPVVVATATDVDSSSSDSASRTPAYPPSCCDRKFGCTARELEPYCPACVRNCPTAGCPCTFPGTNEIIGPRQEPPAVPRAPFCPQCPKFFCPLILIACVNPSTNICTAKQIQSWIN
ncbi:hypothetical protein HA402_003291 [Bradysia odoriphaga]|nr:hypothetical protein HA402_003291 [Bradysia odoriphaga]